MKYAATITLLFTATFCCACESSSEAVDRRKVDDQQAQYAKGQPVPHYDWSRGRALSPAPSWPKSEYRNCVGVELGCEQLCAHEQAHVGELQARVEVDSARGRALGADRLRHVETC